jgi:hypothetical protein
MFTELLKNILPENGRAGFREKVPIPPQKNIPATMAYSIEV